MLRNRERLIWIAAAVLSLLWLVIYLTTVSPTVNFIDSGELITALHEPGVAHPPGYPLYVLLGYVAENILWGDEAWRVNALSAFFGALAVGAFFILIVRFSDYTLAGIKAKSSTRQRASTARNQKSEIRNQKPEVKTKDNADLLILAASAAGASLLAISATFWSRTAQAKMYSLHFFLAAVILILALGFRRAYERQDTRAAIRWLVSLAFMLGLSFTNHLMTVLLVIPAAVLALAGNDPRERLLFIMRRLIFVGPVFLLPLLLYVYMPLRAAQHPIMNWGSTDNWGDFWRHISGWQFRPFLLGDLGGNVSRNTELISRYASEQWGYLSWLVIAAGLVAGALLFRARAVLFWCTLSLLVLTLIFSLFYGISEIEPYMTLFYAVLAVWLGLAPVAWLSIAQSNTTISTRARGQRNSPVEAPPRNEYGPSWAITALAGAVALGSYLVVYPVQNYSHNRLAEQFVMNVFSQLPRNSILITDYWDFYAPTYYLQIVKGVRPDIAIIDKSLLRYPWYTGQLQERYPGLIANSRDIVATFATEQRKWVNGEPYNSTALNNSYFGLLTSFVERNATDHPPYMLIAQACQPGQQCEESQIAPTYLRVPVGLVDKLVPQNTTDLPVPPEPDYATDGITTNPVGFDDAARLNSLRYVDAYNRLAALYGTAQQNEAAQRMSQRALAIQDALKGR